MWALFDVRPECQRLFYRGKQVRRAHRTPLEAQQGQRGATGMRGLGGPEGLVHRARRAHLAPLRVGNPRGSECGPGPAYRAQRGPGRPCCRCARRGRPERRDLIALTKRVTSRRHSPPERLGSLASRAWWGPGPLEGGEGSGLWRPCRSAGGEGRRPPLPAALTRLTARIASVSLPGSGLPNRRGNIHCSFWGIRPEVCLLTVEGICIY